jgi:hypothetical protein
MRMATPMRMQMMMLMWTILISHWSTDAANKTDDVYNDAGGIHAAGASALSADVITAHNDGAAIDAIKNMWCVVVIIVDDDVAVTTMMLLMQTTTLNWRQRPWMYGKGWPWTP